MFDSIRELTRRYPSLVAAAIVLLVGFSFTVYKMATAFSDREATPEYQNRPAAGLAPAPAQTIVDTGYITGLGSGQGRVPDDDYLYLLSTSKRLAGDIAAKRPGLGPALIEAGLAPIAATETVDNINSSLQPVAGWTSSLAYKETDLSVDDDGGVSVSIPVVYTPKLGDNTSTSREGIIDLSYRVDKGKYRLDNVLPPEVY